MKYPKSKSTTFIELLEFNTIQVNVSKGRVYNYWWIEPNIYPIKLKKKEIPEILKMYDLSKLGSL